jgi:hypothetical protein
LKIHVSCLMTFLSIWLQSAFWWIWSHLKY